MLNFLTEIKRIDESPVGVSRSKIGDRIPRFVGRANDRLKRWSKASGDSSRISNAANRAIAKAQQWKAVKLIARSKK